jgi:hypothetical protein
MKTSGTCSIKVVVIVILKEILGKEYFINGIKKSNPYCVFCFKNHTVSVAVNRRRTTGSPLFSAAAIGSLKTAHVMLYLRCIVQQR